jgi:hypothetical protein
MGNALLHQCSDFGRLHRRTRAVRPRLLTGGEPEVDHRNDPRRGVPNRTEVDGMWAAPPHRARAFGLLVGGLTVGSAAPQLIRGTLDLPWQGVLFAAAAITAIGGLAVGGRRTPRTQSRSACRRLRSPVRGPHVSVWPGARCLHGARGQWSCCLLCPLFYGRSLPWLSGLLAIWGCGHRRLRCLLHSAQRDGRPAIRRHRVDRPDRVRVPPDHPQHLPGSGARRCRHVAVRLRGVAAGPVVGALAMTRFGRANSARADASDPVPRAL